MPVRSLNSSVLKWPDAGAVIAAAREWAHRIGDSHPELVRVGMFGSYADGTAGVGSDLDLAAVVDDTPVPFIRRAAGWDTTELPVPADLVIYTEAEWRRMVDRQTRITKTIVWLLDRRAGAR